MASIRSCADLIGGCGNPLLPFIDRFSNNHAKIIAVDGEKLLTGGHNQRTKEYLEDAPVHDVSVELTGSVARDADHFADQLWQFVCANQGQPLSSGQVADVKKYYQGTITQACLATADLPVLSKNTEGVAVMSIARLGVGLFPQGAMPANQSDIARTLFFQHATKTIRLSQQDVGMNILGQFYWPEDNPAGNSLHALAQLLLNDGDVYIALSNYGSVRLTQYSFQHAVTLQLQSLTKNKHQLGDDYYNNVKLTDVADKIKAEVDALNASNPHPKTPAEIKTLLCQHFHLAPLRFSNASQWSNQYQIANHAKVWIIDDKAFYVGSHNLYPANLQEFGVIIGDETLTQEFLQNYWDRLWLYSSAAAISGSEASSCYYQ